MLIRQIILTATLAASLMEGSMDACLPSMDAEGTLFLVNRQTRIVSEYTPMTVKTETPGGRSMRADAAQALQEMFSAARQEAKISLTTVSGYRSYSKQSVLYSNKINSTGSVAKAQKYVAPPGASEHQLGLAMDLGSTKSGGQLNSSFGKSKGGQWVRQNAHRFGFIVRYQEGWEDITGYNYEPWHVRYVGVEHATAMYEQNIPFEIYIRSLQGKALADILEP